MSFFKLKRRNIALITYGSLGFFSIISFQNCSGQIQIVDDPYDVASNESSLPAVCNNGESQTGYAMATVVSPLNCGSPITKRCIGGQWDQNISLSPSCLQQCIHPDSKQAVDEGTSYVSYGAASASTVAGCEISKVTSTCGRSGNFEPSPAANKSCLAAGQICAYPVSSELAVPNGNIVGSTVSGFAQGTATYPVLCGSTVSRSCLSSGQWSASVPLYKACSQKCIHPANGQPVNVGTEYISYSISVGTQAQCDAARVASVCQASSGLMSPAPPASRFDSCTVMVPATISSFASNNSAISSGGVVTLSWFVTGATSLVLNPGMINVAGMTSTTLSPSATTTYTLVASNALGSVSRTVTIDVSGVLLGRGLYDSKCASCHSAFEVSNLKGRTLTTGLIESAIKTKISAMKPLDGVVTTAQLDSIVSLFGTGTDPGTDPVLTSGFTCPSVEAEKNSSVQLTRLNGLELKNTYAAILSAAVWAGLSPHVYLLPPDQLNGDIKEFNPAYTADFTDQVSRFNEQVANLVVSNNTNVSGFFGSCATLTSFSKTCFDTFLSGKAPFIFRSALLSNDNSRIWTAVSRSTNIVEQLKITVQVLLNDPRFLYHLELGDSAVDANGLIALTSYEVANRLSYGMTSAPPDTALWADAVQNRLKSLATVSTHVDRISQTQAFRTRVINFVKFYMGAENTGTAPVGVTEFMSGINGNNLASAVTSEFEDYVGYVIFTLNGNLKDLFSSKVTFPKTAPLASIMGTSVWSSGSPMTAANHPGVLARPYLYLIDNPNLKLVQRGKRVRINMLCSDVPQPSASDLAGRTVLTEADLVNLNRRSYIDKATMSAASCIVCHSKMNQLGFASENFDSIGRYRTTEKIYNESNVKVAEHPVVSSSTPKITENDTRTFATFAEFQTELAKSDTLHQCLSRKSFQFFQRSTEEISKDTCRLGRIDTLIKTDQPLIQVFKENFKLQSVLYKRGI